MQCKDIPDIPILRFLEGQPLINGSPRWSIWYGDEYENSVTHAFPREAKQPGREKLVLAKMRQLMRSGLVDGCGCGCRGDFVITEKGRDYLTSKDVI